MTITRVSDLAQNQLLIAELAKANQAESKTELQVASGKKAQNFADIASQTGVLFSAKQVLDRNDHYTETATELSQRLDVQSAALGSLQSAADDLRQNVTDAVANGSGLSLMDQINSVFQSAAAALNTQVNGQYIFGGTRTDTPPVNISSINDLVTGTPPTETAVPIAGIFSNNNQVQSATINDGVTISYGMTASDLGTQLMTAIQNIKQYVDNNGPLSQQLTTAQSSYLSGQITNLQQIVSDITAQAAHSGVVSQQVDAVSKQLAGTKIQATQFVSDIEDADLPTALTKLQQDQLQLQASARMAANIGQMSLLNFLQ
jgi:flagellar hook-associated protein 3 FlgL